MATDGRVHITFRAAPKAKDWVDDLAQRLHSDRSTVIRLALAVAKRHEPELIKIIEEQA